MIVPVIMAGGIGTRLWPLSTENCPKQFLKITGGKYSMLQETILRLSGMKTLAPIVICNNSHKEIIKEQLSDIGILDKNIILEPIGKNTAPAIALAALHAMKNGEDPHLLVLPADHLIKYNEVLLSAIENAIDLSDKGKLVTFGIVPDSPETGYGYIKRSTHSLGNEFSAYEVDTFVEKPDLETAEYYINQGCYYWNSGMFTFKASSYLKELQRYRGDIYYACRDIYFDSNSVTESDFIMMSELAFSKCPEESIDYAVMEKTEHAVVIPLSAGWNDIGSWSALWDVLPKDSGNNVINGNVYCDQVTESYLQSDGKFIAVVGLSNVVIVNTEDALLVIDKNKVQDVKKIIGKIK